MGNENCCEPQVNKTLNPVDDKDKNNNNKLPQKIQNQNNQQNQQQQFQQQSIKDSDLPDLNERCKQIEKELQISNKTILSITRELGQFAQNKDTPFVEIKNLKTYEIKTDDGTEIYQGQWENKKQKGFGKCLFEDGSYFEGYFYDNKPHGIGRKIKQNGDLYEGEFHFGFAHGKGHKKTIIQDEESQQAVQELSFLKQNLRIYRPKYTIYDGGFINDKMHGKGKQTKQDKYTYIGEFVNDMIEGKGECIWTNGKRYIGQWKNNNMQGIGEFYYSINKYYKGSFSQNKFNGYGEMHWPEGSVYKGQWEDGEMHGQGVLITEQQERAEGNFVKGHLQVEDEDEFDENQQQ